MFIQIYEAPELEVARLAAAPEGSRNHYLSTLPVNITGWLADRLIQLPWDDRCEHTVVVLPLKRQSDSEKGKPLPHRRHAGWWSCIVVASDHPSYPVQGHRLAIPEHELVRGTLRTLDLPTSSAAAT